MLRKKYYRKSFYKNGDTTYELFNLMTRTERPAVLVQDTYIIKENRRPPKRKNCPLVPVSLFNLVDVPLPYLAQKVGLTASDAGSMLFLRSDDFKKAVARGACPVSLCLSVYRWPVRSAVFLCLTRVCSSPAVLEAIDAVTLVAFCRTALKSLGFYGAFLKLGFSQELINILGTFPAPETPIFSGVCKPRAVSVAFESLTSSLSWLSSGTRKGCPVACKGPLARLLCVVMPYILELKKKKSFIKIKN